MVSDKVFFIHGRPHAHYIHAEYAATIKAEFVTEDFFMRWHDKKKSRIYRYISMLICGILIGFRKPSVLFTESVRLSALLANLLFSIPLVVLVADETLYFLKNNKYNKLTSKLVLFYYKRCSAIICIGDYQTKLIKELLAENKRPIYTIYNGLNKGKIAYLESFNPHFSTKFNLLFIGDGEGADRMFYKGLDFLAMVFNELSFEYSEIELVVIGKWDSSVQDHCQILSPNKSIQFVGYQNNLLPFFENANFYIHLGRGDAYPTSCLEAITAGLPCIISTEMGIGNLVHDYDKWIIPLDLSTSVKQIKDCLNTPNAEILQYTSTLQLRLKNYSQEKSNLVFKTCFDEIINNL